MSKVILEWTMLLLIIGGVVVIGNWIGYETFPVDAIPGALVLVAISLVGLIIHRLIPYKKIPSIAYIGIIGLIVALPVMPGSAQLAEWVSNIHLLSITTPILAYAGISVGRSWNAFAKIGWKAVIVGTCVVLGTYLGSALIAEVILRMQGII